MKVKKNLRILLAMVISMIMVCVPVVASAQTLTVTNTLSGRTYDAYLFFEKSASGNMLIKSESPFKSSLDDYVSKYPGKLEITELAPGLFKVVPTSSFDDKEAAKLADVAMTHYDEWKDSSVQSKIATSDTVVFENLEKDGYYLVKSSGGNVLSMVTVDGTGTINEKNSGDIWGVLHFNISRDAVGYLEDTKVKTEFRFTESYDGKYKTLKLTNDYSENGQPILNNPEDITVLKGIANDSEENVLEPVDPSWYSIDTTTNGWELTLNQVAHFDANEALIVNNTATGQEGLEIYNSKSSKQKEYTCIAHALDLKKSTTTDIGTDTDKVRCIGMSITKIPGDSKKVLMGAQFKIYRTETSTTPLYFKRDGFHYYVTKSDTQGAVDTIEAGASKIDGLGEGTYWFEETKAPDGYNILDERVSHELSNDTDYATMGDESGQIVWVSGGLAVENKMGVIIPATGGIGTVIFVVIGSSLIISAIAYSIYRRKKSNRMM